LFAPSSRSFDIPRILILALLCIVVIELGLILNEQQKAAVDDRLSAAESAKLLEGIAANTATDRPKWEYHIATPNDPLFDQEMDVLGAEGWELVAARRASSAGVMSYEIIFKRPVASSVR